MITFITGEILQFSLKETHATVDILLSSGLGYQVRVPSNIVRGVNFVKGEKVELYTSYQVREDSQTLYGFLTQKDRDFFETLITVSGIGPRTGVSILSTFSFTELNQLLEEGDFKTLSKVSGLGPKGAKKIILELQGKLELGDENEISSSKNTIIDQLEEALRALGFTGSELKKMLDKASSKAKEPSITIEALIQFVLKD